MPSIGWSWFNAEEEDTIVGLQQLGDSNNLLQVLLKGSVAPKAAKAQPTVNSLLKANKHFLIVRKRDNRRVRLQNWVGGANFKLTIIRGYRRSRSRIWRFYLPGWPFTSVSSPPPTYWQQPYVGMVSD